MFGQVDPVSLVTIERKASLNLIIRLFCLKEKNTFLLRIIFLYSFGYYFYLFRFCFTYFILLFLLDYSMIGKIIFPID